MTGNPPVTESSVAARPVCATSVPRRWRYAAGGSIPSQAHTSCEPEPLRVGGNDPSMTQADRQGLLIGLILTTSLAPEKMSSICNESV